MSCDLETELTAYVDGELSPKEVAAMRAHLLGCATCRSTEALLRNTLVTLEALSPFEPSVGLRRSVLRRLDELPASFGERVRALLRPAVVLPSAAALLSAGVVAALLASPGVRRGLPTELQDNRALDVAMNYEVLRDYQVLGLESPDDVEVVAQLDQLEGRR
ncbi:MAG: anti-sigma factor family protein [Myxococcaceae bacterium]